MVESFQSLLKLPIVIEWLMILSNTGSSISRFSLIKAEGIRSVQQVVGFEPSMIFLSSMQLMGLNCVNSCSTLLGSGLCILWSFRASFIFWILFIKNSAMSFATVASDFPSSRIVSLHLPIISSSVLNSFLGSLSQFLNFSFTYLYLSTFRHFL